MDPVASIEEMISLAQSLQKDFDREMPLDEHTANRLAELVMALHEWRLGGGYDPYRQPVTH